jgi:lysosomal alpha-mannosidase
MQKRIRDKRPSFNLTTDQTVSSNYYPINSAIAIVDESTNLQLTVMNDRSQGGASLANGAIELMQNRRLFEDDDRGVNEPLNETDAFGNGIVTHNTYKVHFFNRAKEHSHQRLAQLHQDLPVHYFFGFDYKYVKTTPTNNPPLSLDYLSGDLDVPFTFKQVIFPYSPHVFLVRFENIGDKFDKFDGKADATYYVDVVKFASMLYKHVNGADAEWNNLNIRETTLSGNQQYSSMKAEKIQWRGEDDDTIKPPTMPEDKPDFVVALNKQRLRNFYIEFIPFNQK